MSSQREQVCVSTWSFHTLFEAEKPIDALDFPEMVADRYQVHNVEIVYPHFRSTEPSYVAEFRERLRKAHSRVVNVPIDHRELWETPSISSADPSEREHALGLYRKGIDMAAAVGSAAARCDPGLVNLGDPAITIESYRALVAYGKAKSVRIVVENHGSISRHPEVLVNILEISGAGALPDMGNFPDAETRERGLRLLFPLAQDLCHAKSRPQVDDLPRCVEIAKEVGFRGVYSIEAGGGGDPYEAVQEILDVLLQSA